MKKLSKLYESATCHSKFRKNITHYRRIGYNLNAIRQSACLVFKPIMVDNYAVLFNCIPVGRASDSTLYDDPELKLFILVGLGRSVLSITWPTRVQLVFFFFCFCSGVSKCSAPMYLHRRAA